MTTRGRPRTFGRAFKLELMRQWTAGERSCTQLGREHGIHHSVLYRWRDEYRVLGEQAFAEAALSEVEALQRRVAEREQALGRATREHQILKRGRELARSRSSTP
jgi:transposase-like protein